MREKYFCIGNFLIKFDKKLKLINLKLKGLNLTLTFY